MSVKGDTSGGVLALILARAGSKGLPGKNELDVAGRPMLAWTVDCAREAACVERVVLTTDGERLAEMGRSLGVEVVERPGALADDTATVDAAARHAVTVLEAGGASYSEVVLLYGNVPVRPSGLVDRAVSMLRETGCDSVQSVCGVGKAHPYWMKTLDETGRMSAYEANQVYRRQDLPPVYLLDGGLIAVRRASLFVECAGEPHAFLGEDRRAVVTEPGEVIDIDTAADLAVAEAVLLSRGD
ncbi:acylneuraminate cytidylyltransferase family protein [Mucisphaera calidilacus]|uniref:N-acylneuraminate cytidylyltransferase n=1 Tax=Mucisphaera calidilacus TaxID=2527982 RepID=A0A518C106_9BACT|nr:acylneuraminate cytidylyltransferase family protein [Mucisphaera calidilacus]QDU72913.1 N-acylneuraminate cytidylyltransferase [Mucisphaera calidilacus]